MPTNKTVEAIEMITDVLLQANVATGIIFPMVMGIATLIRGLTNSGPTLLETADKLEVKLVRNDSQFKESIARMKALLSQQ